MSSTVPTNVRGHLPPGLRVIEVTAKWALGEFDQCVAVVWAGKPDPESMMQRSRALEELCRRSPGRCALIEVVEATSKPPVDETRRVAMEVFRRLGNDLTAIAFVVEGNPVRTTLVRAIITGMLFFVKQPQPSKVFGRISDLAEWVRLKIGVDDPHFGATVAAVFEHLRYRLHHPEGAATAP